MRKTLFKNMGSGYFGLIALTIALFSTLACVIFLSQTRANAALPPSYNNPCTDKRVSVVEDSPDVVKIKCEDDGSIWFVGTIPDCPAKNGNGASNPAPGSKCPDGSEPIYPVTQESQGDPYGRSGGPLSGHATQNQLLKNNDLSCKKLYDSHKVSAQFAAVFCPYDTPENQNAINVMIGKFANYIVGLVGVIMVIMIIVGGIQMAGSAGNPEAIKGAKKRITNVIISLVVLLSMRIILTLVGIPF